MCDLRLIIANQIALRGFFLALWQTSLSHSFLMSRTFHGIKFKIKKANISEGSDLFALGGENGMLVRFATEPSPVIASSSYDG